MLVREAVRRTVSARPAAPLVRAGLGDGRAGRRAVRRETDVGGVVVEQPHDEGNDGERRDRHGERGDPPPPGLGNGGQDGKEDELTGGAGGSERPGHDAAMLDEPPSGHGGDEDQRHGAGTEADEETPAEDELPALAHEDGESAAGGDEDERGGDDAAHAETLHEGGRKGGRQSKEDQVDRHGGRDRGAGPAELRLQWRDQHARRGSEPGGADDRDEGDGRDRPGGVDPPPCGSAGPAGFGGQAGFGRGRAPPAEVGRGRHAVHPPVESPAGRVARRPLCERIGPWVIAGRTA